MGKEKDHHPVSELTPELLKAFSTAFLNRDDCYPIQTEQGSYVTIKKPLIPYMVKAHLKGVITIGAYALDRNSRAKWLCFDGDTDEQFNSLVSLASELGKQNLPAYLEQSRRGGHLWLFTPTLSGKHIRQFGKQLLAEYQITDKIELYPKQDKLITGTGSLVRLPFGIHRKTHKRYHFITPDGQPLAPTIRDQINLLAYPERIPQSYIDQLLSCVPEPKLISPTPSFENLHTGSGNTLSETIKATVSVIQFVSQFVQLDSNGKGFCPFHEDDHPSFQVNTKDNYWHSYAGCGGGSVIDFWMKWRTAHGQDGSFTETIKELRKMVI